MNSVQLIGLGAGFALLLAVMVLVMTRTLRKERQAMERRRQAWIAAGSDPDDTPNFYAGPSCSSG